MIYPYCLMAPEGAATLASLSDMHGVTGEVHIATTAMGHLVYGETDASEIMPRRRNLLAHARVLENCLAYGSLLPMRFGMLVGDMEEIHHALEASREDLKDKFALINEHAEFGIRVGFDRQTALDATVASSPRLAAERRRLLEMARPPHMVVAEFGRQLAEALDRRRGAVQRSLAAKLAQECRAHVIAAPQDDVQVLHMHVLALPDRAESLAQMALDLAAASRFAPAAEPQVSLVGPVPPFNFVQLALGAARSEAA